MVYNRVENDYFIVKIDKIVTAFNVHNRQNAHQNLVFKKMIIDVMHKNMYDLLISNEILL